MWPGQSRRRNSPPLFKIRGLSQYGYPSGNTSTTSSRSTASLVRPVNIQADYDRKYGVSAGVSVGNNNDSAPNLRNTYTKSNIFGAATANPSTTVIVPEYVRESHEQQVRADRAVREMQRAANTGLSSKPILFIGPTVYQQESFDLSAGRALAELMTRSDPSPRNSFRNRSGMLYVESQPDYYTRGGGVGLYRDLQEAGNASNQFAILAAEGKVNPLGLSAGVSALKYSGADEVRFSRDRFAVGGGVAANAATASGRLGMDASQKSFGVKGELFYIGGELKGSFTIPIHFTQLEFTMGGEG